MLLSMSRSFLRKCLRGSPVPMRSFATSSRPKRSPAAFAFVGGASVAALGLSLSILRSHILPTDRSHELLSSKSFASVVDDEVPKIEITLDADEAATIVRMPELEEMLAAHVAALEVLRTELKDSASVALRALAAETFDPMVNERVPLFADWYFSYSTTYQLLGEAFKAAVFHQLTPGGGSSSSNTPGAVVSCVEDVILQRYNHVVLRPELSDGPLRAAFEDVARASHACFVRGADAADRDLLAALKVASASSSLVKKFLARSTPRVRLSLDWSSQLRKARHVPANIERKPVSLTATLSLGGAVAGKVIGGSAAKGVLSKLAAPFASKAALAGATAGVLGGPGGTAAGAAIGVAVDAAVNSVHGLLRRGDFIVEVSEAVRATETEYLRVLENEVHRAIDSWVDSSLSLHREFRERCEVAAHASQSDDNKVGDN